MPPDVSESSGPSRPPGAGPLPAGQERAPTGVPIVATLKEAVRLLRSHPRTLLLPLAVVTIPVAILVAAINATLYLTVWSEQELLTLANFTLDANRPALFAIFVLAAAEALFTQVARGATIVAVAGVTRGNPPSLAETLDPAFTRLGGLVALIATFTAILMLALLTGIGLLVLPYVALRLALGFDVYMLEAAGPIQALQRSWQLMRGNILRLLGLTILAALCGMPFILVASMAGGITSSDRTLDLLLLGGYGVLQTVAMAPVMGLLTACTTLYYLKARARHDAPGTA